MFHLRIPSSTQWAFGIGWHRSLLPQPKGRLYVYVYFGPWQWTICKE